MNQNLIRKCLFFVLALTVSNVFSQTLSGNVSTKNEPLPGVSVVIKGTNKGTTTDFDGNFTLSNVNPNATLVFSYLGFVTQEIEVSNRNTIQVVLEESLEQLEEVVLIGYGQTQRRKTLSTAISTVSSKQIEDTPVARVENLLQGAAAGVVLQQNSGAPGSTSTVRVRGVGSPSSATSNPLYIVDGLPVPDIQHINPDDIKDLVVLKDAASIAIYGSRGSNGVILVKTKSGSKNKKTTVSINGYSGYQFLGNKPDLMNASEYINYYNQAVVEANGNLNGSRGAFSEAERNLLPDTDWYEQIAKPAAMSNIAVSLAGGGETFSYLISGGNFNQEGIFSRDGKTNYNRKNINASFNADLRKNIQLKANIGISKIINSHPVYSIGSINALPPIYPTHDENGEVFNPGRQSPNPEYKGVPLNVIGEMTNPLWELNKFQGNEGTNSINNYGISVDWQPVKDLNVSATYNHYINDGLWRDFTPSLGAVYPTQDFFLRGSYTEAPSVFNRDQIVTTATYTFSKLAEKGHHLDWIVGYEVLDESFHFGESTTNVSDYLTTDFSKANFALATDRFGAVYTPASVTERGLVSYLTRFRYDFNGKYLATASFRIDKSSTFGENFESGYFPAISLGWVVSEESFLNESKWIDLLKIRGGWGISGIDASSGYDYLSTINSNVSYAGNPGLSLTKLANPNLKWEGIEQWNAGIDLTVFNNLGISIDYYSKETSDILLGANTPDSSGLDPATVNIGAVKNSGYELSLSYTKKSDNFSWNANLNAGYNKNEVTSLGNNGQDLDGGFTGALFAGAITRTSVGQPIGSFYGYVVEGVDVNGNLLFKDLNDSNNNRRIPDDEDKTFIGKPLPDWTAGLNLGASFSRFDFSTFIYGATGNEVFDATIRYTAVGSNRPKSYLQEGAPRNLAIAAPGDSNGENLVSDFHIKDASFIKLKNVVFGYSLPESIIDKLSADKIRLYVSGQNLFTLSKYGGADPEIGGGVLDSGIDRGFYPQSRSYLLGFQINF